MTRRMYIPALMFAICVTSASSQLTSQAQGQKAQEPLQEQSALGAEENPVRPAAIPDAALVVLTDSLDRGTTNCLKNTANLTPDQVPASWFVASEIHLGEPNEVDLIVEPNADLKSPNGCLRGAHVVPFWVLKKGKQYELLLATDADALQVLDSRTNFYRDIQTTTSTPAAQTRLLFKFHVAQYQLEKRTDAKRQ